MIISPLRMTYLCSYPVAPSYPGIKFGARIFNQMCVRFHTEKTGGEALKARYSFFHNFSLHYSAFVAQLSPPKPFFHYFKSLPKNWLNPNVRNVPKKYRFDG